MLTPIGATALGPAREPGPPLDLTAEQAAQQARDELAKGKYQPNPISRFLDRILTWFFDRLDQAGRVVEHGSTGSRLLMFGIVAAVAAGVVFAIVRGGGVRRRHALPPDAVLESGADIRSPDDYRREADRKAAEGDYNAAIRLRFRACVADLVFRAILDDRPGRTAMEAAAETATAFPEHRDIAAGVRSAAGVFNEVVFGSRRADRADYEQCVAVDDQLRRARVEVHR